MSTARFIVGDALKVLRTLPANSVDGIITSSPYFWKRNYLPDDHESKPLEVGQEATPGDFLAELLAVMDEAHRVVAPHGSVFWNLGDSASGSGGAGGDYRPGKRRAGQPTYNHNRENRYVARTNKRRDRAQDAEVGLVPANKQHTRRRREGWPDSKSVCWLPPLFGASLAYGANLLTLEPCTAWTTRPPITWCKEQPSVGELIDTVRVATELVIHAVRERRYFFDLDAIRSEREYAQRTIKTSSYEGHPRFRDGVRPDQACNPLGAPPLDWQVIGTANYTGAHYAVMPDALVVPLVLAAIPERVCTVCGQPWERLVTCDACGAAGGNSFRRTFRGACTCSKVSTRPWRRTNDWWAPCDHADWRPGVVLDPFAGSGTTLAVATGHGRDAVGIDLDERNADLARQRVGMLLTVEGDDQARPVTDVGTAAL